MLNSSYLAGLSDGLVELYSQLEADIIADMAKRLKRLEKVTEQTEYQAKIFQEAGGLREDVNRWLSKYEPKAQKELQALFNEALEKSAKKDLAQLNKQNLSDDQEQILNATVKKVAHQGIVTGSKKVKKDAENGYIKVFSGVQRATMTIASSASNDFVREANRAYMKVASGAFDYQTALIDGIEELAKKGIHTVEYTDSGKPFKRSVESMLRANIMTGINQTATQITLDNCEDLDCQLVEVSAHLGARPEHEAWQGQIYSLVPGHPKYKYFYDVCGYGTPTGICGINCRHSFYPYFEGTEPLYSKGELDEYKEKTVTVKDENGKEHELTVYEAEQKQRYFERQIRMYKRTVAGLEAGGKSESPECLYARNKIYEWQKVAKDFSTQTGLVRDYSRERIGTKTGVQPKGIKNIENKSTGAFFGGIINKDIEEQESYAERAYLTYKNRKSKSDINKISKNTGINIDLISMARKHLFETEMHLRANGNYEPFAKSFEIVQAWERLERGHFTATDIVLLRHEAEEARLMSKYGFSYERAHWITNLRHPWQFLKDEYWRNQDVHKIHEIIRNEIKKYPL